MERQARMMNYRKYRLKKYLVSFLVILCLIFVIVFLFGSTKATADDTLRVNERKYYTSYVVQSGDTLWDIASDYMTPEYVSTNEYIAEVMETNQMDTDALYPGQLLLLPYYADEPLY